MQLITREVNHLYALVFPGAKILLALFAVFCTVGAIRLDGITAIALSSIGISTAIFFGIMVSMYSGVVPLPLDRSTALHPAGHN